MRTFLTERVEFKDLLKVLKEPNELQKKIEEILDELVTNVENEQKKDVDLDSVNHQLYYVSCVSLDGKSIAMMKNLSRDKTLNGIIGWCKLAQDCSSMTAQRLHSLATKVYHPKRCKTYAEANAAIEEWKLNVNTFCEVDGQEKSTMSRGYSAYAR